MCRCRINDDDESVEEKDAVSAYWNEQGDTPAEVSVATLEMAGSCGKYGDTRFTRFTRFTN